MIWFFRPMDRRKNESRLYLHLSTAPVAFVVCQVSVIFHQASQRLTVAVIVAVGVTGGAVVPAVVRNALSFNSEPGLLI